METVQSVVAKKRRKSKMLVVLLVIPVILIVWVLLQGPLVYLTNRLAMSKAPHPWVHNITRPTTEFCINIPVVGPAYRSYHEWWVGKVTVPGVARGSNALPTTAAKQTPAVKNNPPATQQPKEEPPLALPVIIE